MDTNNETTLAEQKKTVGAKAIDLAGKTFGRLLVLHRAKSNGHGGRPRWVCVCECGSTVSIRGAKLRGGDTRSCGCFRRDRVGGLYKKHGKSKTIEYTMFYDARKRAIKLGLPFDITPDDITVPEFCPVLGIKLLIAGARDNRPSLDRIKPSNGYVKTNIAVISFRANRLKSDASPDEIKRILSYMDLLWK